ncbi:serpin family protein, partial [Dolichospermum sp. ST_sed3]|nr:serpin family protein [Dolichospermum sp. ST_sed3]
LNFGFIKLVENSYNARVSNLDFSHPLALKAINGWISDQTDGKIERIVDKLDNNAVLYLINAVYFKGYWTKAFNKANTKDVEFILANGSKKMVPMMSQTNLVKYYQEKSFEAISLPYGNGKISMYIFVPSADSNLKKFVSNLNVNNWENWIANFRDIKAEIVLPKFRIGYETVLNDNLKKLGMGIAFGSEADFGGICKEKVFISEIKHKTFMEVNEEGTEAVASTSVAMTKNGTPKIIIDRPFFCAIKDNTTGSILFMGYVVDPAGDVTLPNSPIKTRN